MISIKKLTDSDHYEFIKSLEKILTTKFNCSVDNLPDNYSRNCQWGLLTLLEERKLHDYGILYYNNVVWAATGGIIRQYNGEKIYQAAFRGFSCANDSYHGVGMKPLVHQYLTLSQIQDAVKINCSEVIISFNEHNKRLFDATCKYIMPRALPDIKWIPSSSLRIFNNVPQWLMTHDLKY